MARAGAVAKRVIVELESMGIDIKNGTTGEPADAAKAAFYALFCRKGKWAIIPKSTQLL